jgi:UDP-2-acetamido-3-amino-2,3-dideoxy-glucuronate N-acetyltransferase
VENKKQVEKKLLIDDIRSFPGCIVARSASEGKRMLTMERWDTLYIDYDLGKEKNTGLSVIEWLKDNKDLLPEKIVCVSDNKEGAEKINSVIEEIYGTLFPGFFVHPTSIIDDNVIIGDGTKIWHWSHVSSGATIGKGCNIGQSVFIGRGVSIGNHVKIQNNVSVYTGVTVEDEVFLGPSCVFTNDPHPFATKIMMDDDYAKTVIKRGASIGAGAVIVCSDKRDIIIGERALVGAGAVVTKDVEPDTIVVGNPARPIRQGG